MSKKYFIYTDESWLTSEEQYMLIWALFVPSELHWKIHNKLDNVYWKAKWKARISKLQFLDKLIKEWDYNKLKSILSQDKNAFEMKFWNIQKVNLDSYKDFINEYFKFKWCYFACLVIDKKHWIWDTPWDLYINRYILLLHTNIKQNFSKDDKFVVMCDWISTPKTSEKYFEDLLYERLMIRCINSQSHKENPIHWVVQLASHSTLLLQAVDLLLWSVMCFMKQKQWLSTKQPKIDFAEHIKESIWWKDMTQNLTVNKPNYFSVWHYDNTKAK